MENSPNLEYINRITADSTRKLMKTGYTILLCCFLIISCNPVALLRIQVLEPASDPLTDAADDLVLINRAISADPVRENELNPDSLKAFSRATTEALHSLAVILNESPGFSYLRKENLLEIPNEGDREALDSDLVIRLCDSLRADGLVSLEYFHADYVDAVFARRGTHETGWANYYEGRLDLHINVLWRAYSGETGEPVDEYSLNDTMRWVRAAYTARDLYDHLPVFSEALLEAAYFVALDYARRIAPYWIEDERPYYSHGNRRMRQAARYIAEYDLDNAEKLYVSLSSRTNSNISAAAFHNLALIHEIRGDYLTALKLARQSYQERMHPVTGYYLDILEERYEKSGRLDRQLTRSQ
jgi:hypothetical protein